MVREEVPALSRSSNTPNWLSPHQDLDQQQGCLLQKSRMREAHRAMGQVPYEHVNEPDIYSEITNNTNMAYFEADHQFNLERHVMVQHILVRAPSQTPVCARALARSPKSLLVSRRQVVPNSPARECMHSVSTKTALRDTVFQEMSRFAQWNRVYRTLEE